MCGIAGALDLDGTRTPTPERIAELERMISLLGHRGPDESGYFLDDRAALAAVRLSIIDLAHGQQPMSDPARRYWIVSNGEIYNFIELRAELEQCGHQFQTRCDTEVALRAWMEWGEEAPAHFDGGFAFALYDRVQRSAFLVRDRFGKRPLFYSRHGSTVLFGSEMKALLARRNFPFRWDVNALAGIFSKWTPIGAETPFEGVRQVPAGTILRINPNGISERQYAGLTVSDQSIAVDFEEAACQTASLLNDSVRLRLRSDVEVGVLLSGGLDSTITTHLVHQQQPGRLRSFSVSFADSQFDEAVEQECVVRAFNLTHAAIRISPGDIAGSFQEAVWHAEFPQFRTAFVPMFLLARFTREHGIKVVLSGEGADEIFLGYDIFKETRLRHGWSTLQPEQRRERLGRLYPYLPHFSDANLGALGAVFGRSATHPDHPFFSHALRLENGGFALRLLRAETDGLDSLRAAVAGVEGFGSLSPVKKAQWLEFHTLLQGYLLSSQGDRMMFAHGVEPRCPFLSPSVVSYAAGLPERFLLSPEDNEKHVLKRAFRNKIPPEILARPKQPYRAPDASSFLFDDGRLPDWVEELLSERALRDVEPVCADAALRLVTKLRATPKERISPREDQAFVLLLSTCVLNRQFIQRNQIQTGKHRPPLATAVNMTGASAAQ